MKMDKLISGQPLGCTLYTMYCTNPYYQGIMTMLRRIVQQSPNLFNVGRISFISPTPARSWY